MTSTTNAHCAYVVTNDNASIEELEIENTLNSKYHDPKYHSHFIREIIIPKLNLPSSYPISLDQSRLTENKRTRKFCTPAQQIVFINRKKIVAVKYSNKFLEKRTAKKKKKKFDWDF